MSKNALPQMAKPKNQKDAPLLHKLITYRDIFTGIYSHAICVIAILYSISRRNINYTTSEFMTRGFFSWQN